MKRTLRGSGGGGGGAPSGAAGGVLGGTYPNPSFAADMATQAELDAVAAAKADLASPALTGNPTAPTQSAGDSSTKIASTAFSAAAITLHEADTTSVHGITDTTALATRVETVNTNATAGSTETLPEPGTATIHLLTLDTANCVLTFPAAAAGKSFTLALKQDASGSRTVTWPAAVTWAGAVVPTLTTTASKTDIFTFVCINGTDWRGFAAGLNFT